MGIIFDFVTTIDYNNRQIEGLGVVTMKKDKRINVRANNFMVSNLRLMKLYYDWTTGENYSYSDIINLALIELVEKNLPNNKK